LDCGRFWQWAFGTLRAFPEIPQHGWLVVTLWGKLRYEGRLLMERFPEYDNYRHQTKRLIPFVW
jgi:protein-S-isoprenylcysteine O-methyltransferase Ste14